MINAEAQLFGKFDVVVFDWDGTIADSVALVVNAFQQSARIMGFSPPDEMQTRQSVGLGMNELLEKLMPLLPVSHYAEFADLCRRYYFTNRSQTDVPFAGMTELLRKLALAGRRLAVATGKSRGGLDRALRTTGLERWFETSRCAEEGLSKPNPWMLKSLADEMGVEAGQMVMIGDSIYDIDMAKAFGCASIGVHFGERAPSVLVRSAPDGLAGSVEELARLLQVDPAAA
ncbi:MAG: HAD-IA family hydrolase [Lautropia sp.]|nr:HAD-IA family hydrolase [Lautropia sp.]